MAVAIAWLPGPAGTRRRVAKPSVEEPDAAEPARPDLWGARVSNDPGLPDPERRRRPSATSQNARAYGRVLGPSALRAGQEDRQPQPVGGIVKLRLTAVSDTKPGGFATGLSPVSWGSIDELFVNLTMPCQGLEKRLTPYSTGSRDSVPALPGDIAPRCSPRRVALRGQSESSLRPRPHSFDAEHLPN